MTGAPDAETRREPVAVAGPPRPPIRVTLRSALLALALGAFGGWLARQAQLPLPWMIGAMCATTAAAMAGLPVAMSMRLRTVMVTVLGVMLGGGFAPGILERMADWSYSIAGLAFYAVTAGAAAWLFFHHLCGYDRVTSYFAAMPGGLSEMVVVGAEMGGDTRIIALSQSARLLLVVLILPFGFQFLVGYEPAARPPAGLPLGSVPWRDLAILAACGVVGYAAARAIRLPAPAVIGPMVVSAGAHLAGWTEATPPVELVNAAQVVVGAAIGCRFAGASLRLLGRALGAATGGTVVLLGVNVGFAAALHAGVGLPLEALVLAYSPGGLAEMSLIALAIGTDAAFVATHHIVRIFLIVTLAPIAFRLLRRGRGRTG